MRRMWSIQGLYEKIEDNNGINRFIGGEITPDPSSTGLPDGMEKTYSHWSLSGNHLMIVIAGTFTKNVAVYNSQVHGFDVKLPKVIYDKLYPCGSRGVVAIASVAWWDSAYNRLTNIGTMEALKYPTNNILTIGALQLTEPINSIGSNWRVAIDILID